MGLIGFGFRRFSLSRCGGVGKLMVGIYASVSVVDDAQFGIVVEDRHSHPSPPRKKGQRKERHHQHQQLKARTPDGVEMDDLVAVFVLDTHC